VRGTMMPVLLYRPPAVGAGVLAAAGGLAEMKG